MPLRPASSLPAWASSLCLAPPHLHHIGRERKRMEVRKKRLREEIRKGEGKRKEKKKGKWKGKRKGK
jgi:hypothetical protein